MATPAITGAPEPKQDRAHATRRRLLDAAVDELLERGYVGLTTQGVARRAGVSRGAQQSHFPHKATLVAEAVRHLALRQCEELRARLEDAPRGRARVRIGLDILFEYYSGPLFAAVLELSLAARGDADLAAVVAGEERTISRALHATAGLIFGGDARARPEFASRWATTLSAIRGLALLKRLGHSPESVDRQWTATRQQLVELMIERS